MPWPLCAVQKFRQVNCSRVNSCWRFCPSQVFRLRFSDRVFGCVWITPVSINCLCDPEPNPISSTTHSHRRRYFGSLSTDGTRSSQASLEGCGVHSLVDSTLEQLNQTLLQILNSSYPIQSTRRTLAQSIPGLQQVLVSHSLTKSHP